MLRYAMVVAVALMVLLPAGPGFAVTAKEKMATCKFGADNQKLKGAARKTFMKRCMSNKDDPRGSAAPSEPPK